MSDPAETLRKDLEDIFADLTLVPASEIVSVFDFYCREDGCATLMLETADGGMLIVSAEPGRPLGVQLYGGMF